MTSITFHITKSGEYKDFICSGHAGAGRYGKDIVCASISVLVINTINSLEEIAHEKITVESDEERGLIVCRFEESLRETSKILVDSLVLGLSHIAEQYGRKYCKLEFKEV
ncbi:MAG: ribosomal-processing cysteine protease Prp [Lachnospiraceae bacterium]|nr:ribosomal-processing cysteine protease Prp [Lachnospiraceae bacterium]